MDRFVPYLWEQKYEGGETGKYCMSECVVPESDNQASLKLFSYGLMLVLAKRFGVVASGAPFGIAAGVILGIARVRVVERRENSAIGSAISRDSKT